MLQCEGRALFGTLARAMPSQIRMANGIHIPFIGLGTGEKASTVEQDEFSLRTALDIGYRHIDTAQMYETEPTIGRILKEYFDAGKLKREDVFVTTKLPPTANQPEAVEPCLNLQLKALGLEYVDLYLIHSPCSYKPHGDSHLMSMRNGIQYGIDTSVDLCETWRSMEKIYHKGLAKSIGVSNFTVKQIQKIYSTAEVKPHNLQIEVHVHWPQKELLTMCQSLNITVTAYAPIGCPGKKGTMNWPELGPVDEPLILALAEKYKKTPAQILLRHLTQRNIIVVPRSTNEQRLRENFESSSFFLTDEDIAALNHIEPKRRLYSWAANKSILDHPEYPFPDCLGK